MKHFLRGLPWFLLLALLASIVHYYFGEKWCGTCGATKSSNDPVVAHWAAFSIADAEGNKIFTFPDGFLINNENGEVEVPESMQHFRDSIFNYLNAHQDEELLITGKYLEAEGEARGMDRANFLKNLIASYSGINKEKLIPQAILSDYSYDENGKNGEGIGMVFRHISEENMKAVEESITSKTLYADFGDTEFKPDNTLTAYALELKNYLNNHSDKNVTVTGHTDDVGSEESNYNFGLKRAQNVVTYLISQGIDPAKIKGLSKGETEPIADNSTEEGKAQNRRITILVE
jgi:outer membrane protein OmpA-like peptidoglycan-associated protein